MSTGSGGVVETAALTAALTASVFFACFSASSSSGTGSRTSGSKRSKSGSVGVATALTASCDSGEGAAASFFLADRAGRRAEVGSGFFRS